MIMEAPSEGQLSNVQVSFRPVPIGRPLSTERADLKSGSSDAASADRDRISRGPNSALSLRHDSKPGVIAAQPASTRETAQPFEWGQTIYGSADERPYAPSPNEDGYAAMMKGFQWFKFTFRGKKPRLA